MGFTYEKQETSRFLVYQTEKTDRVDSSVVGIVSGSKIDGVLKLVPVRVDGEFFFKYNVTGLTTLKEYLSGYVEKKRLLDIMENLIDTFSEISKYMLNAGDFILETNYIFVDTSKTQCFLTVLPVEKERTEVKTFFNHLISSISIDITTDNTIGELLQFLHPSHSFSLDSFRTLLQRLKSEAVPKNSISKDILSDKTKLSETDDPDATVLMDEAPTVLSGPRILCLKTQKVFHITKEISLIGRNPEKNDFCIEGNPEIGREAHASILWREGELRIRDNHSHNGVFIDGHRIEPDQWHGPLDNGSHFCLAREEFEIQYEGNVINENAVKIFPCNLTPENVISMEAGTEKKHWKDADAAAVAADSEKAGEKKGLFSFFYKKSKPKKEQKEKISGKEKKKHSFGNFSIPDKGEK